MKRVRVRPYTMADYPALRMIQEEAFPPPFPEELWWQKDHIQSHADTFPEGGLLAEVDGVPAGSATSLIVTFDGKPHTWEEVSDSGYIQGTHDPNGDTLYGIDLCVRPSMRGSGVAQALYAARKQTVCDLGLKRFVAACRIPGFNQYSHERSVEDYVEAVVSGECTDLVLTFMLKQGLRPVSILPNYVEDEESHDYAVLVEWLPL